MASPSFDSKCYDLAQLFLADTSYAGNEDLITELAGEIQQTIEDFLESLEEEPEDE
jgi:hypothetical protein